MRPSGLRARYWIGALLIGCALLVGCAPSSGAASHAATATTTPATTPLATPALVAAPGAATQLGERVRQAIGTLARKVEVTYDPAARTATITITISGVVPLSDQQVAAAHELVKRLCYDAGAALWSSGVALSQVTLLALGPMQDSYANIITDWYGVAVITASSAQRIPWTSLSPDAAWNLYDQRMLRVSFGVPDEIPD